MNAGLFLLLLLLGLIWGASFLFIKVAVATIPPFTIVLARTGIAALCLWLVIRVRDGRFPSPGPLWRSFFVMGLFNGAIPYTLINWGEQHIEAGLAAIFNGLMPLFTILFAHFTTRDERFSARKGLGVALGLAGVAVLMGPSVLQGLGAHFLGQLAVTAASASYAVAAIYGKRLAGDRPLVLAAGQMTGGALLIGPLSLSFDRPWTLSPTMPALLSVLCLGLLGTAFAYVLYYRLLARIGATRISLVTYIIPLSGVFWGWAVLGERLAPSAFAGLVMILASVAAVGEMGLPSGSRANFDPFGWAGRLIPERTLHTAIRAFMVLVCSAFLIVRAGEWDDYLVKPLWLMETMVYIVLIAAFIMRTSPRERSRGLAE
ncbi:MAG: DMT family transporter, partial [bacterium]